VSGMVAVDRSDMAPWQRRSLWVGTVALSVSAIGASFSPGPLLRAYLAAYLFYLGIALGSMALLMVYRLTGGSWGFLIRRILEAGMGTLPLLAVLFLPIACGIRFLYLWAQPEEVAASPQLQYQQFYLAPVFFWTRAAIYFAIWMTMAYFLASWSRREDQTGDARLAWKSRQLAAFGAVAYGISLHFAAVDWGMSLQPVFHSTIWGPLFAAGQLLSALACALLLLSRLVGRPPLAEVDSRPARSDLASLLLTLLILWAYMAWFQFMLIWIANLPVDVVWYLPRASTAWLLVTWAVVLLHFAVPFFLLLMRPVKRNIRAVAWIAGLILFMQLVYMHYQVIPDFPLGNLGRHWMALLVSIGVGGIWLANLLRNLERFPLLALHDSNRAAALRLRRIDDEETCREEVLLIQARKVPAPTQSGSEGDEGTDGNQAVEPHRNDEGKETSRPESAVEHAAVRYEPKDIGIRWLVGIAVAVCCFAVIQNYGVWRYLWFHEHTEKEVDRSPYPSVPAPSRALPPQPRLEQIDRMAGVENPGASDPLAVKERALHGYGPTAEKGFVHIPIRQAIKAVAGSLPVAEESSRARAAHSNGLLDAGESNSGRMFRGASP